MGISTYSKKMMTSLVLNTYIQVYKGPVRNLDHNFVTNRSDPHPALCDIVITLCSVRHLLAYTLPPPLKR